MSSISLAPVTSIFQDVPLVDRNIRLTLMELKHSDKQIVNELVYRWCRILTRPTSRLESSCVKDARKVLIIDMIGSVNPVRLATVLKRDERRMMMVAIAGSCKINSTFVTVQSHLKNHELSSQLKLVVIYHDEFFIIKTIKVIEEFLKINRCQCLLVVPKLDRQEQAVISLMSYQQVLRCDFKLNRTKIEPGVDGYNEVYFRRGYSDRIDGELKEDGLHLKGRT